MIHLIVLPYICFVQTHVRELADEAASPPVLALRPGALPKEISPPSKMPLPRSASPTIRAHAFHNSSAIADDRVTVVTVIS
tara:strand:+ start:85 stop:327 length:243 start_codon:yes stop_codon:yes gene_type:complete